MRGMVSAAWKRTGQTDGQIEDATRKLHALIVAILRHRVASSPSSPPCLLRLSFLFSS